MDGTDRITYDERVGRTCSRTSDAYHAARSKRRSRKFTADLNDTQQKTIYTSHFTPLICSDVVAGEYQAKNPIINSLPPSLHPSKVIVIITLHRALRIPPQKKRSTPPRSQTTRKNPRSTARLPPIPPQDRRRPFHKLTRRPLEQPQHLAFQRLEFRLLAHKHVARHQHAPGHARDGGVVVLRLGEGAARTRRARMQGTGGEDGGKEHVGGRRGGLV
jgi:hypothetical protein